MKHFYLKLVGNVLLGAALALLTFDTIHMVRDATHNDYFGWISATSVGPGASISLLALVLIVVFIDLLWALFFALWLIKKWLRIKDSDNTLYLP